MQINTDSSNNINKKNNKRIDAQEIEMIDLNNDKDEEKSDDSDYDNENIYFLNYAF